ncbi:MFS transporter [Arthrobacter sp. W4I7]|uniref:MFS transporter n=1 Tax=Arthrobacter sp. W4I7 TaxID=3042296 RepID=UPI0027800163|nr:MFS transporter [Arthrobacter sp. W4I7]MDQ0691432.1 MFS family permease [Arthrobacter sp. W4I7]
MEMNMDSHGGASKLLEAPISKSADLRKNFWVLFACFLGTGTGALSLVNFTVGATIPILEAEYGFTRASAAALVTVNGLVAGFIGIGVGMAIDRVNLRAVLGVSIPLFAAGQVFISIAFANDASVGLIQFLFGLAAFLGAGTTTVAYTTAIAGRFTSARGLALGLMGLGAGICSILLPPMIISLEPTVGVPGLYLIYAALVLLPWPFVLATFRADHQVRLPDEVAAASKTSQFGVLRSSVFWRLLAAFAILGAFSTVLFAHTFPALVGRGIDPIVAASALSLLGLGSLSGRLISGYLLDVFQARYVAGILIALAIPGLPASVWGPIGLVYGACLLAGVAIGTEMDFLGYYLSRHFGVAGLAFKMSLVFFVFTLVGAPAPFVAGLVFEATGSYDIIAAVGGVAVAIAALLIFSLPKTTTVRPRLSRRDREEVGEPVNA